MSNAPALPLSSPPDLLRRFAPLPHDLCIRSRKLHVHLRTNEPGLAAALGKISGECRDKGTALKWIIISDSELQADLGEAISIKTSDSTILTFGRAGLFVIAYENRELTGFVAAALLERTWPDVVLPALMAVMAEIR